MGIIFMMKVVGKSVSLLVVVKFLCFKISCVGNWVLFVVLDFGVVVIKEIYSYIELVDNNLKMFFSKKSRCFKDSMYIFWIRKVDVMFIYVYCVNNKND